MRVSKNKRQMIAVEKELAAMKSMKAASPFVGQLATFSRYIQPAAYALLVIAFWSTPVASLPASLFAPFGWILAFPGQGAGNVAILPWCVISHVTVSHLARSTMERIGVSKPEVSSGILGTVMRMIQ